MYLRKAAPATSTATAGGSPVTSIRWSVTHGEAASQFAERSAVKS
jgi:hypothetical protein